MSRWIIILYFSLSIATFASNLNVLFSENNMQDSPLWLALFSLFAVSILYMFISSNQIKRLKNEQLRMKEKYKFLEEKQHDLLASMGESIHNIAKQTLVQTSQLAEKTKKSPLHAEIQSVMSNENELLDVTSDLIQFIQLKSKKIIIRNEIFNFNHVLNETIGLLTKTAKKQHTELIFDVNKNVPNSILADSSHLGQILVNLLEYCMQHSQTNKVRLLIDIESTLTDSLHLVMTIEGNLKIKDKENFFDTSYNNKSKEYIGLGLFIAKELVNLMQGTLSIEANQNSDNLHIIMPIQKVTDEKIVYRLSNEKTIDKHILVVDIDNDAATALEKRLTYFQINTTVKSQKDFNNNLPNFANYDIIILNQKLFTPKIVSILSMAKKKHHFKILAIENLYNDDIDTLPDIIDFILYKPFSPEYIFELLQGMYSPNIHQIYQFNKGNNSTLNIHKEPFTEVLDIELEDFSHFAGKRLLLVEDNFINQKLIQSVLSKSDLSIDIATNGEEALYYLESNPQNIDFILMDINMPVMDGFTATEHIRKQHKYDHIPIVSLTALVADYEIAKMFSVGMNGYLSKPISLGKLYTAFNTFLDKKDIKPHTNSEKNIKNISLDGLNTKDGLLYMQNNISFYKEVLREFMSAYEKSDIVLELLINQNRYDEAQKLSLDIKGLADTIGANEISELCNKMYNLLIYNKYDNLNAYAKKYKSLLNTLKNSIETYLQS